MAASESGAAGFETVPVTREQDRPAVAEPGRFRDAGHTGARPRAGHHRHAEPMPTGVSQ
ncbi:hypothetical protein ACFS5L_22530 [Streptomyces phyllanthi]|uniref:hypothetical protein n=1 Tax=Streptomyces phyllanthi TaxID=1803180 RepID=UPI001883BD50|nr:hypothetical protein [Streptomyces phyllanthi]